jgi:polyisoprenoid-binding protein YceI
MRRSVIWWIVAVIVAVGGAAFAYVLFFAGGSGEPSTDLTTPEVIGTSTTQGVSGGATGTTSPGTTETSNQFVIDPTQSTASFTIEEVLRGNPNTVVGTTREVAGQVVVDPEDLGASQFSPIVINARTLSTDSSQRDRAMRSPVILDSGSDANELITFTPLSVEGLDGSVASVGDTYDFQVTGDLVIKGATDSVTFDVTVEMVDAITLRGSATADVLRSDFGIGIPNVPFVADVADEVGLSLEFVAANG